MWKVLLLFLPVLVLLSSCSVPSVSVDGAFPKKPVSPEARVAGLDPFPGGSLAVMLVSRSERSRTVWWPTDTTTGRITLYGRPRADKGLKVSRISIDFVRYYREPNRVRAFYVPEQELVIVNLRDDEYEDWAALLDAGKPLTAVVASYPQEEIQVSLSQR